MGYSSRRVSGGKRADVDRVRAGTLFSPWPGLSRPSTSYAVARKKDVDARHKAGHDGPIPARDACLTRRCGGPAAIPAAPVKAYVVCGVANGTAGFAAAG